ncbi:response regulator transcription factor [Arcanobacterium pinnipediorum]|uniref:Response regulator transcription factor n=1 Tax=Arcanobacterium pinnipediorum TaxID=1503041 RepID=A0ABY5AGB6_9ACTO|nr:response regulator transcription factor [Arcanobacterium pinnipediorum]USR79232.1 response regulator transcription factor [Arcanobacterium pinnipediorum]
MIRVVIADDQTLVRGALCALLNLEDDIDVVGDVGRGDELIPALEATAADVAVVDIEMPGLDGIAATQAVRAAGLATKILIVTTFGRPGYLQRALTAGASGFMVKDTPAEELAGAIRQVYAGGQVVDPGLATQSLFFGSNPLTERERELLRVAEEGATVSEIAAQVFLSEGTVRNHLSSAIGKTGTATRAQAARVAREKGWL